MSLSASYESPIDGPSVLDMELALSAFPVPPSHIPRGSPPSAFDRNTVNSLDRTASIGSMSADRSSIISNNPPPSHPPLAPLPPLPRAPSTVSILSASQAPQTNVSEFGVVRHSSKSSGRSRSGSVLSVSAGPSTSTGGRTPLKIRTDLSASLNGSTSSGARPMIRSPTSASADGHGNGPRSSTGSLYSITAGRSAAESLRERVGGLLAMAPAAPSTSASTLGLMPGTMSARPISPAVPTLTSTIETSMSLLTAEELNLERDPMLARALSPMNAAEDAVDERQLLGNSNANNSNGVGEKLSRSNTQPQPQRAGQHQVKGSSESGVGLGPSLTRVPSESGPNQHPSTSSSMLPSGSTRAPPSSFKGPKFSSVGRSSSKGSSSSSAASKGVTRTLSQSRAKPLPGLPATGEGATDEDDKDNAPSYSRKSRSSKRSNVSTRSRDPSRTREDEMREDGAASPDIASIISSTPRPSRRLSKRSVSSSRSASRSASVSSTNRNREHGQSKSKSSSSLQISLALSNLQRQQNAGDVVDMVGRKTSPSQAHTTLRHPPLPDGAEERVRLSRVSSAYSAGTSRLSAFSASSGESGGGGYLSFSAAGVRARSKSGEGMGELEEAYAGIVRESVYVEEEEAVVNGDNERALFEQSHLGPANGEGDFDPDMSADYGVAFARHRGTYDLSLSLSSDALDEERDGEGENFYAEEAEAMLEERGRALGGLDEDEKSDSGSDLDLHTPLPQILLREGVLSPNSKVLTSMSSCNSLLGGRDSVASNFTSASITSVMTKSGLFKDERDTDRRRRRHRDGRLLREGLGLTTGLGWSDSEDEDAPSPLTHRLSTLAVSRNPSMSSFKSNASPGSRRRDLAPIRPKLNGSKSYYGPASAGLPEKPHPLSKSLSANTLAGPSGAKSAPTSARNSNGDEGADDLEYVLRAGAMGPPSAPPYANTYRQQAKRTIKGGTRNYSYPLNTDRDSNRGSVASSSGASASGRSRMSPSPPSSYNSHQSRKAPTSAGSAASVFSLTVSIPEVTENEDFGPSSTPAGTSKRRAESSQRDKAGQRSTSPAPTSGTTSSSSTSLPYPPTPLDDEVVPSSPYSSSTITKKDTVSPATSSETASVGTSAGFRPKTPTNSKATSSQVTSASRIQMRPRAFSSSRSAPASATSSQPKGDSNSPSPPPLPKLDPKHTAMNTPRPLRLPALHLQKGQEMGGIKSGNGTPDRSTAPEPPTLQPGQPQPKSGSLLGYNRQLHDRQKAAASGLAAPQSSTSGLVRPSYANGAVKAATISARSTRSYGSLGVQSSSTGLHPPATAGIPRTPSSAPGAKPRTGTGMMYRQSSSPAATLGKIGNIKVGTRI